MMQEMLGISRKPIRVAKAYASWFVAILFMYLMLRWRFPEIFKINATGALVGAGIAALWAIITIIRAIRSANKGIFYEKPANRTTWEKRRDLTFIITEIFIPFVIGYFILSIIKVSKSELNMTNAVWSLIFFVLWVFYFICSAGYFFLEWHYGAKFYDLQSK
jgi:hypothetical protein